MLRIPSLSDGRLRYRRLGGEPRRPIVSRGVQPNSSRLVAKGVQDKAINVITDLKEIYEEAKDQARKKVESAVLAHTGETYEPSPKGSGDVVQKGFLQNLASKVSPLIEWVRANKKKILITVSALIAVVGAVYWKKRNNKRNWKI